MLKKKCIGKVPTGISSMSDVELTELQDSQALVYNAEKEKWVNGAGGSGGTIGNGRITLTQGGNNKGSFTVNQSGDTTIDLDAGGGLELGETAGTAYEGSKGKDLADRIADLEVTTTQKVSGAGENNIAVLTADGDIDDSEVPVSQVVLQSNTAGLLKNDGTVDTDQKALAQDLTDEITRATNAESALNTSKIDKLTALFVSGHLASINSSGGIADSGYSVGFLQDLNRKIADIYSRIAGFSVSLNPGSVVVGSHTDIEVTVTCVAVPDEVNIYRQSDLDHPCYTDSNPQGTVVSFTDTTVVPDTVGTYKYVTVVTMDGNDNTVESELNVTKIPVTLTWSANSATAYIGADNNVFPTVTMSPALGGGSATFRSTNTSVATVNASGQVTLIGAGSCQIYAEYAGDSTHMSAYAYYNLEVRTDSVTSLTWEGYSLSPASPRAGEQATLTKGTVYANYASGKTRLNVTNHPSTTYAAVRGTLSGTTYTAPNSSGADYIKVNYGGKEASFTISVDSPIYAYIGAGASVNAVAVNANKTTNYGSGSQTYNITAADDDYIYILLPNGTPFVKAYSGGQEVALTSESNTTIGGISYNVRRTDHLYPDTYVITVKYTE